MVGRAVVVENHYHWPQLRGSRPGQDKHRENGRSLMAKGADIGHAG
jgi:hypothetical protein